MLSPSETIKIQSQIIPDILNSLDSLVATKKPCCCLFPCYCPSYLISAFINNQILLRLDFSCTKIILYSLSNNQKIPLAHYDISCCFCTDPLSICCKNQFLVIQVKKRQELLIRNVDCFSMELSAMFPTFKIVDKNGVVRYLIENSSCCPSCNGNGCIKCCSYKFSFKINRSRK